MQMKIAIGAFVTSAALAAASNASASPAEQASNGAASVASREAQVFSFEIPAGALASALNRLADAAGLSLVYSTSLAEGLTTKGLSGRYNARDALAALLSGSGLVFQFTTDSTVKIEKVAPPGARTLGPVQVEGQVGADLSGPGGTLGTISERGTQELEAKGYRPVVATVASSTPRAIEEIPRSISVLTQEQMKAQDIQTFDEALKSMPGLTYTQAARGAPSLSVRGYTLSKYQVDGSASYDAPIVDVALFDLGSYERVELVRGANGAQTGQDSPGGTVNLVRKRPTAAAHLNTEVQVGQWDFYRGQVDYSTPALFDSPIGFRAVTSYEDRNFFYEKASRKSQNFYAIADAKPFDPLKLELGMRYNSVEGASSYDGLPRYMEGDLFPFSPRTNLTPAWAIQNALAKELFTRAFWDISKDWKLQGGAAQNRIYSDEANYTRQVSFSKLTDAEPEGFEGSSFVGARDQHNDTRINNYDLRLDGRFDIFGLTHNVSLSADFTNLNSSAMNNGFSTSIRVRNLSELVDSVNAPPNVQVPPSSRIASRQESLGITLTDTISWRERADVTVTARRNQGEIVSRSTRFATPTRPETVTVTRRTMQNEWRPTYSASVKLPGGLRAFVTYAQGSRDQSTYYSSVGSLSPMVYANREAGLRFSNDGLLATLSYYELTTENSALEVLPGSRTCGPLGTDTCYFAGPSTAKSKGIDLEINGALTDTVSLVASFNYNHNKTTYPDGYGPNYPLSTQTPSKMAKAWIDWRPSWTSGLGLQLGVSGVTDAYASGTIWNIDPDTREVLGTADVEYSQKSYAVFDAGARYRISDQLSVALLAENLADTTYCQTIGGFCYFGTPRTAKLTVSASF